jgi:hypothetical protein
MADTWNVGKRGTACARCEKAFEDGERHFSSISFAGERLSREDSCERCFAETPPPPAAFYWRSRFALERSRRVKFDLEALREAFLRLDGNEERAPLRYLVALVLLRKRVLRFRGMKRGATGESDRLLVGVGRKGETQEVVVPDLPGEKIEELREALRDLMGLPPLPSGGGGASPEDLEGKTGGGTVENGPPPVLPKSASHCESMTSS